MAKSKIDEDLFTSDTYKAYEITYPVCIKFEKGCVLHLENQTTYEVWIGEDCVSTSIRKLEYQNKEDYEKYLKDMIFKWGKQDNEEFDAHAKSYEELKAKIIKSEFSDKLTKEEIREVKLRRSDYEKPF